MTYYELMIDLTKDKLYSGLLGHGLFSEHLPPVFTSEPFLNYFMTLEASPPHIGNVKEFFDYSMSEEDFKKYCKKYCKKGDSGKSKGELISYKSIRNTGVPRLLSIPNPFVYQKLCYCLKENWGEICEHFKKHTEGQSHKISRIHIRRLKDTEALLEMGDYGEEIDFDEAPESGEVFRMRSEDWKTDGTPENDLHIGSRYKVEADVSNCFPSIYSHAIPWALSGKDIAKTIRQGTWDNCLDCRTRNLSDGETTGMPIGPHASNLIAEIILVCVDSALQNKWKFVRKIDDYICYVKTIEDAERFLLDLEKQLEHFKLRLNSKKVMILKLPQTAEDSWVNELDNIRHYQRKSGRSKEEDGVIGSDKEHEEKTQNTNNAYLDYKSVRWYFDTAIKQVEAESDAAIFKYAIKTIGGQALSENAKKYTVATMMHLCHIYPYLIRVMDDLVFAKFLIGDNIVATVKGFADNIFHELINTNCYEGAAYCLYFALKYGFEINQIDYPVILQSDDCVLMVLGYLYVKRFGSAGELKQFNGKANELIGANEGTCSFESNWLFAYEVLPITKLSRFPEFAKLKESRISFVKSEYR